MGAEGDLSLPHGLTSTLVFACCRGKKTWVPGKRVFFPGGHFFSPKCQALEQMRTLSINMLKQILFFYN